jgi:ABC-type transport system involved in multi-copper enzyme maturation permease subunit
MGGMAITYMLLLSAIQNEYKNNTNMVINSLPVSRREVVTAKYLSVIVFTLLGTAVIGVIGAVVVALPLPFHHRYLNLRDIVIIMSSSMLMTACILPFYFKTGGKNMQMFTIVLFLVFFFAPAQIAGLMSKSRDASWVIGVTQLLTGNAWLASVAALAALIILFLVSMRLTIGIYEGKDF